MGLVAIAREDLEAMYVADAPIEEKRAAKAGRLETLRSDVGERLEQAGRDPSHWLSGELNNARLASMTLYEGRLPEFRALLDACDDELACFYEEARRLAGR